MPTFDPMQIINALTVNAQIGPLQWAVVGATILVVRWMKNQPDIPTPKWARPYIAFAVGLVFNVGLEYAVGNLAPKTLIAEQFIIWITTLGIHGFAQSQKADPAESIRDPRDGRDGDPRRP